MIVGSEKIKRWLELVKCPFWRIKKKTDDQPICEFWFPKDSQEAEKMTVKDGLAALDQNLDILAPGTYFITAKRDLKDLKNANETYFQHVGEGVQNPQIGAVSQPMQSNTATDGGASVAEMVQKRVLEELAKRDEAAKVEALKKELAEYKKKDSDYQKAVTSAIGQISPFVTNYGEAFVCGVINCLNGHRGAYLKPHGIGKAQQTASTAEVKKKVTDKNTDVVMEVSDNIAERTKKVIEDLQRIEPSQWLELLEAIVKLHDTNASTYNMARGFLINN